MKPRTSGPRWNGPCFSNWWPWVGSIRGAILKAAEAQSHYEPAQGKTKILRRMIRNEAEYPEVNPSEKILLLIDECHRSHSLSQQRKGFVKYSSQTVLQQQIRPASELIHHYQ